LIDRHSPCRSSRAAALKEGRLLRMECHEEGLPERLSVGL
jgi:hypothetical protein